MHGGQLLIAALIGGGGNLYRRHSLEHNLFCVLVAALNGFLNLYINTPS